MRVYTVHRRGRGLFEDSETLFVKEGFCWPAFVFGVFWALWHRMWIAALLLAVFMLALAATDGMAGAGALAAVIVEVAVSLLIGFEANDWRRRALARHGFEEVGVVCGRREADAEMRFFRGEAGESSI